MRGMHCKGLPYQRPGPAAGCGCRCAEAQARQQRDAVRAVVEQDGALVQHLERRQPHRRQQAVACTDQGLGVSPLVRPANG